MKKLIVLLCALSWSITSFGLSGQPYMDRFNTYWAWSQQLPLRPGPDFFEFIKGTTPLSQKLRDRWLYELARIKDWNNYLTYYQPSNDINLVCYNQIAQYHLGHQKEVATTAMPLWLTGDTTPPVCNALFDLLLQDGGFNQDVITQRLALALDKKNIPLAQNLVKLYKQPHTGALQSLNTVYKNPTQISQLTPGEFNDDLYLYGLKRMISINMNQALKYWDMSKTKKILNEAKQQAFLTHIALYKAMRNNEDALFWFAKIKPKYYTEILIDWQIRLALKRGHWKQVSQLINQSANKDSPCWQYWLARSLEEQNQKEQALAIYEPLAKSRQYYGFLASMRLQKMPSFDNEKATTDKDALKAYQPFIDQVKNLYQSKQEVQASRMLNDFISELPKEEASALVYWVDNELQWHGKSVYLSNNEILNNQLSLRFPLAYQDSVLQYSKKYAVPPEFVYAIIRQESGFREDVTSSAGARGLMQVMPRTALVVSKEDKIPYNNQNQLFVSQKNINIGIAYLKQLAKRFSNHPVLIAASYNAGPKQVVYWLKTHPPKDIDVWIETLPWQETRNYLKNVMAFYLVYQYRLNQKPNMNHFLEPLS
ncbi:MAG: transglycosylase SLT domain-containing protein [Legionellales bacterium]